MAMTQAVPAAPDAGVARETLVRGLRDAHAMEKQSEAMLSGALARVENYPMVERMLRRHLEETRQQIERLDTLLEDSDEKPSVMKDATGGVSGVLSSLGQSMAGDEILKNGLAMYAFEAFEAAAYQQLVVMAQLAGQSEAVDPLKQSLAEERAMVGLVGASGRPLVHRYLELSSDDNRVASR